MSDCTYKLPTKQLKTRTISKITKDSQQYNNYLPLYFSDWDYHPLCTSLGCVIHLC